MDLPFQDRVALVTGGTSGIGRAAALRLARLGAAVAVSSRRPSAVEETLAALRAAVPGVRAGGQACDVAHEEQVEALVASVGETLGPIDILVHSAGMLRLPGSGLAMLHTIPVEECHAVIDTNIKGTFYANRAVLRSMMERKRGDIVNIASILGIVPRAFTSVYCASKFGMVGMTEALAEEMRPYGIRVCAILPEAVDSGFWDKDGPSSARAQALTPDRVAAQVEYVLRLPRRNAIEQLVVMPFRGQKAESSV